VKKFLAKWILANGFGAAVGWALGERIAAALGAFNPLIGFTCGILVFRGIMYFAQKRALGLYGAIPEIARFWRILRLALEIFTMLLVEGFLAASATPNWGMVGAIYFFISDSLVWLLFGLAMSVFRRGGGPLRFLLAIIVGVFGTLGSSWLLAAIITAALEAQKFIAGSLGWAVAGLLVGSFTGLLSGIAILLSLRGLRRDYAAARANKAKT
jgi:hypothetical protein